MDDRTRRVLSRRQVLSGIGVAVATAPLAHVLGCATGTASSTSTAADTANAANGDAPIDGGAATSSPPPWATGGTASMKGTYRDPFAAGLGVTCSLLCSAARGPCYAEPPIRRNISEGELGLPVRMSFLVVDESCKPIDSAEIDLWHAAPRGVYSGDGTEAACTLDDPAAIKGRFFRGRQTADPTGRIDFDTVFPGWYRGRTVHVHFRVRVNAFEYVTSELVFDDALVDDIIATQPIYRDRGPRDTTNRNDDVMAAANAAAYTFETERRSDGVMVAWKALVVRASLTATPLLCTLGRGTEGPGGVPGG